MRATPCESIYFLLIRTKHEYAEDISITYRFIGLLILTLHNNSELHSIKFNFFFFLIRRQLIAKLFIISHPAGDNRTEGKRKKKWNCRILNDVHRLDGRYQLERLPNGVW